VTVNYALTRALTVNASSYGLLRKQIVMNSFGNFAVRFVTIWILGNGTGALAGTNDAAMRVHFISVGQAATTLLEFPCGAVLVDAGVEKSNDRANLLGYLDRFFQRRQDLKDKLDSIVITHRDRDHINALKDVVEKYEVKNFVGNGAQGRSTRSSREIDLIRSQSGRPFFDVRTSLLEGSRGLTNQLIDPINFTGTDGQILALWGGIDEDIGIPHQDLNNQSVVLRVDFGQSSALLTGDIKKWTPTLATYQVNFS